MNAKLDSISNLLRAWLVSGRDPDHHERAKKRLLNEWPVLARALEAFALAHNSDALKLKPTEPEEGERLFPFGYWITPGGERITVPYQAHTIVAFRYTDLPVDEQRLGETVNDVLLNIGWVRVTITNQEMALERSMERTYMPKGAMHAAAKLMKEFEQCYPDARFIVNFMRHQELSRAVAIKILRNGDRFIKEQAHSNLNTPSRTNR